MDKLVEELLELHCKKCEGLWYRCNSCAERTAIVEILKKHEKEVMSSQ